MMPGLAQSAQLCQHYQYREYVAPNEKNQVMQSMIGTVEHPLSGLRYAELTSPVRREDVSKGVNKGLTIKKKLPIKKRHSAGAGANISLDSESCSNSRLEVASTVSSSDLESAQSNAADSPFQPLVGQRNVQLRPIRTTAAIAGISAQVRQDERAPQGYVGKHSASIQTGQESASTAHATPWQASEDDPSPRKLEIRRSGMSTPTRAQQHVQHAPTPIIEEPYESLARLSIQKSQHEVPSFAANQYMGCSTPSKMRHASKSPQCSQKMDAHAMEHIDYNYAYGCHGYESDADMSETFHLSANSQYTMQAPTSPRTLSGSASPQKLAIRRTNQAPDHRGGYFQHSHDQHGFLSPRHMQRQLITQQADVSATFAQHDAEYMHAYQAEYMRQHRRASVGAPLHHQMPDACLSMSTAHLQRWDEFHTQPQLRFQGLAVRRAARPDKNKLPSAEELNLPGWF